MSPSVFSFKRRPDLLFDSRQFSAAFSPSPCPGVVLDDQPCPLDRGPGKGGFAPPILPPFAGALREGCQRATGPGGASGAKPLLRLCAGPVPSLDGNSLCGMEPRAGWNIRESSSLRVVERIVTPAKSGAGTAGATGLGFLARTGRSSGVGRNAGRG
jgi:hypothetical protein